MLYYFHLYITGKKIVPIPVYAEKELWYERQINS